MRTTKYIISIVCIFLFFGCATKINISGEQSFPYIVTHKTPKPTVLIAHGCDGWNGSPYYTRWALDLYSAGYNAVLIDSFGFRGYKNICTRGVLVPPNNRSDDFEEAAKWIKTQLWHSGGIAIIGFSHGGSTALNIANNPAINNIDAVIAYYPGCNTDFIGRSIYNPRIPAQVHLGDKDDWTPAYQCGSMEKYQAYHYLNATHAFDIPWTSERKVHGFTIRHDKEATELSKQRVFEFLDKTIKD